MANDIVLRGGDQLYAKLREMAANVKTAAKVRIGFMEDAKYPDGTSVALVAAVNEFGAPSRGQPPRPFFRRMIAKHESEWPDAIRKLLVANNYDAAKTLDITGEAIAGQLRQSINDLVDPPLAPATIRAKGFDKPLIETSHMINSIRHEVK